MTTRELWILGGTGRIGRAVARILDAESNVPIVLVGRHRGRLDDVSTSLARPARVVVSDSPASIADLIRAQRPAVVVNTLGSYADSGAPIARACMPGGHYVDLANDLTSLPALLDLHDEAVAADSTLVTGAGFGVLGTEAAVAKLCEGRTTPKSVRVDALGSVDTEAGLLGPAFAASIIDVFTTGGRQYRDGRVVATRLGSPALRVTAPDGSTVPCAGSPSGELVAAHLVSRAPDVVATSALIPTSPAFRAVLPVAGVLLKIGAVRRILAKRLAGVRLSAKPRPRPHSWGHAVAEWPDGVRRECWLQAGEAMDFTATVTALVAARLADGQAPTGAYTPAGAFGAELAVDAGGEFILQ
ncbi:saccharopine dehydrogenase NADP-binding domain-containing protein [Spelaeicoccus albus]|uniref:Short subunit dehydrogenase-like uncharacterized protein n=1 Tax=Spelaeicoccus albus TaxID=1280376 RepID=A0A7Z0D525_9MICO|nr:saccharopine dehydrogenase NADP-binding domain-containing protein [Spelaeicoccus albus]NYI69032.1 short subunit dehydrogenase-like uncharacterized protein [Spelaeicoccus albus]